MHLHVILLINLNVNHHLPNDLTTCIVGRHTQLQHSMHHMADPLDDLLAHTGHIPVNLLLHHHPDDDHHYEDSTLLPPPPAADGIENLVFFLLTIFHVIRL